VETIGENGGAVLVVGAGPVGLTMAAELARHGVRARVIDRAPNPLPYCRALGITPRTLEVWDDMGIARSMIERGLWLTGMRSVIADGPAQDEHAPPLGLPFAPLGLPQYETEGVLTDHLGAYGVAVERGCELTALSQDEDGVDATIRTADGSVDQARFAYVVGCDGAHSTVRKAAGIGFDGEAYPWPFMLGDVHIDWDLPYGMAFRAVRPVKDAPPDMFIAIPLPEPGRYRVSMLAPPALVPAGGTEHGIQAEMKGPSLADLQTIADDMIPGRPRLDDLRWSSIFRISMRLASQYRQGRLFIAGDAAHIHPPTGGQGMNTGIQDAYNLAWKLALVLRGRGRSELLDTYDAERHPVGSDVVGRTKAASENYGRERGKAPDRLADTQILVTYRDAPHMRGEETPAGTGGPVAGDRAPDVEGLRQNGLGFPLRLFEVLKGTGHVLLIPLADPADRSGMSDVVAIARDLHASRGTLVQVVVIAASPCEDSPHLTVLTDSAGAFSQAYGPGAVLVRPDGHIGWRGVSGRSEGLTAYLDRTFA
jgi:2-polyprenyl-6-methoxyphenol hydroxylase-like FAD-dependent oxidoreductase